MDPTDLTPFLQFGAAGLIAWMWLTERRASTTRDRQLTEAHDRLTEQRTQLNELVTVIAENTKALTALESVQRRLTDLIDRLATTHNNPR